jgi:cytochrome c
MRVGPGLAGLFEPGGPTLPANVDYGGNLPNGQPITGENVSAWIRSGGQGQIGVMPANGNIPNLTDADLADLLAYLASLEK